MTWSMKKKKGKKADIMRLCLSSAVWDSWANIPASQIKMTLAGPNFHFRNRWVACLRPWWGVSEQATHCIPIIHFGIAVFQNGLLFRFLLSALVSLHSKPCRQQGLSHGSRKSVLQTSSHSSRNVSLIDSVGISHFNSLKFEELKMTRRPPLPQWIWVIESDFYCIFFRDML